MGIRQKFLDEALYWSAVLVLPTKVSSWLMGAGARLTTEPLPSWQRPQDRISRCLADHPEVLDTPPSGSASWLHYAIDRGWTKLAKQLAATGRDLDVVNDAGETPLWRASEMEDKEVCQALLSNGANVNRLVRDLTVLNRAIMRGGQVELMRLFLQHGASPNAIENEKDAFAPLKLATFLDREEETKLLLEYGADPFEGDRSRYGVMDSTSPKQRTGQLLRALNPEVTFEELLDANDVLAVEHLLDRHPEVLGKLPRHHRSWLGMAIQQENEAMVALLLQRGVNASLPDKDGHVPLWYSIRKNNAAICRLLLEHGADQQSFEGGESALHYAVYIRGDAPVCRMLVKYGADLEAPDEKGEPPLVTAIRSSDVAGVLMLAQYGADLDRPLGESGDMTPLKFAKAYSPAMYSTLVAWKNASKARQVIDDLPGDLPGLALRPL